MDEFTWAYFEAALWSSTDASDAPLDANYTIDDIAPETRNQMINDARGFQQLNDTIIELDDSPEIQKHGRWALAGHDFWLTRNNHGAGFEDGQWPKFGEALAKSARGFGEFDLYVGDDGLIYGSGGLPGLREAGASPRYPERRRAPGRGPFVTPRVADFNTLDDLVQHAADQLGATHAVIADPETRIYFPRGGEYPYEEARVWRKAGYWHAEGPQSRQGVSRLPRDAQPIDRGHERRAAEGDPWRGQPRRPALPDQRLIDALATEVVDIQRKRRITFEQAYDSITPKPDWLWRYWTGGGDKIYSENVIINRAKQLARRR